MSGRRARGKELHMAEYRAAAYLRLSQEDGDKAESDSIGSQRSLIGEYIRNRPGITLAAEYVDDGYSGASYDRPGFQRMIKDIQNKKINCVVVKDLSRLGRNYIETGKYIEKIFPFLGVRFIAVNDSYDSADPKDESSQIIVPFKNLINDAYCRDISMKVRSQLDVKRKNGQFIGSFAPYGYRKDPEDNNRLLIDEYAAGIVRQIFQMKLEGANQKHIADTLNESGVLCPAEYKRRQGIQCYGFAASDSPRWCAGTVTRVLQNEVYTGTMVQGKRKKVNYKVDRFRDMPPEEWFRVEGTHEAVISRQMFEDVQRLLSMDTRTAPGKDTVYLFSGIVECGGCGGSMCRRTSGPPHRHTYYLTCGTHRNTGTCSSHLTNVKKLEKLVLETIQRQSEMLIEAERLTGRMDSAPMMQIRVDALERQIVELEQEAERYRNLKTQMYVDFREGIISQEEYVSLSKRFSDKIEMAKEEREGLVKKRDGFIREGAAPCPWMEEFRKYGRIQRLDRQIITALVEKIVIYSKNEIHVIFRYGDEMKAVLELAGVDKEGEATV